MEKLDGKTVDIVQNNIEQLKQLFPEVFTEDKIMWDRLQQALGEHIETDKERYDFTWNGKTEAIQLAQKQSTGTLRPAKEESVNWDTTQNLYIEGDNLEVLRLLQNSYRNKVKMIFIDPPYNTGKDFVYKDNFKDNIKSYKETSNQNLKTNAETEGRYHTNWLNMIYPRIKLSKNLLSDDGVIFISIDDNEVENLKKVCNEIFGEENFISCIIWEKRYTRNNDAKMFSTLTDYILMYRKSNRLNYLREPRTEKNNSIYKNFDNDPRGPWTSVSFISQRTKEERANLSYDIVNPFTNEIISHPVNAWKYSSEQYEFLSKDNRLYWGKKGENQYPRLKRFLSELNDGVVPVNLWNYKDTGTIDDGTKMVDSLIGKDVFDYPKPVSLIERMLNLATLDDSLILDFFSGSGSTAHAVLSLNAIENKKRKFIMVQIPQSVEERSEAYKQGFYNICDIGKERIRRAGKKIIEENVGKEGVENLDIGFKVFKLDDTNLKAWDEHTENVQDSLLDSIEPIKEGRTQEDVVYEVLLKYGIDLTVPIEEIEIADVKVYSVGLGYLFVCLETELSLEQVEAIAKEKPSRVVFYDDSFKTDVVRTNAQQILQRYGVVDIRVL